MIIRLCFYLGIQPVFIPIREPWRNGIVEHFHYDFERMFFRSQHFDHFDRLCQKAKEFEDNRNHPYSIDSYSYYSKELFLLKGAFLFSTLGAF